MWKLMNYEKIYDYGTHKKRRKIQNGTIFKIITYFINCGKYAFFRFTTIWIFPFYYPAWMPFGNDDDFRMMSFGVFWNLVKKNKKGF
jgi:hypothetical protein